MTARNLFILAVRLLGLYFILQSITYSTWLVSPLVQMFSATTPDLMRMLLFGLISTTVALGIGFACLMWAERISYLLTWPDDPFTISSQVTIEDVSVVSFRLMGILAILFAIAPAMRSLGALSNRNYSPQVDLGTSAVYVLAAGILIVGPHHVLSWLARIPYDAEREACDPLPPVDDVVPEEETVES